MNITISKDATSGHFKVKGELYYADAVPIARQGCDIIHQQSAIIFDLRDVIIDDDAILALLIKWTRCAKKLKKKISFINVPQKILDMMDVSGLTKLLPIKV